MPLVSVDLVVDFYLNLWVSFIDVVNRGILSNPLGLHAVDGGLEFGDAGGGLLLGVCGGLLGVGGLCGEGGGGLGLGLRGGIGGGGVEGDEGGFEDVEGEGGDGFVGAGGGFEGGFGPFDGCLEVGLGGGGILLGEELGC